jgi:hypothetical protein
MKNSFLLLLLMMCSNTVCTAIGNGQSGINETFAILYQNAGPSNTYYDMLATTSNPDFNNANLGTYNCNGVLFLKGAQSKVYKCSGGDITNNELFYRIYKIGATPGSFSSIGIGYLSGFGNGCGGADQTWETANSTVNVLSGLGAGTYKLEMYLRAGTPNAGAAGYWYASNNGANYIAEFTVTGPSITAFANQAICAGQTGFISYTTSGGIGAIAVTKNGTPATSPLTGLVGGNYTLVATDANGCSAQTILGIAPIPSAVTVTGSIVQPLCAYQPGVITFTASGGSGALTTASLFGAVTSPMNVTFDYGYVITATDVNGCTGSALYTMVSPAELLMNFTATSPNCVGGNGLLGGGASGGIGPYAFSVNGAAYTTNLAAGTYTVGVVDAHNCSLTQEVTVAPASPFTVGFNLANNATFANGANMLLNITAISGTIASSVLTGPNGFTTSTGQYNAPVVAINSGVYTATATSTNGCVTTETINIIVNPPVGLAVSAKVFLGGAYNAGTNMMSDALRMANVIPSTEPYSAAPYNTSFTHANGGGGETIGAGVLANTGPNAIVDWVMVQLRGTATNNVLASKSALVQRDGDVVSAADGVSPLQFLNLPNGNYFIAVLHRNHLGVMTSSTISLSGVPSVVDFTSTATALYTLAAPNNNATPFSGATNVVNGKRVLYAGNCQLDAGANRVFYGNGLLSDRQALFTYTNGANLLANMYSIFDVNMDAKVNYTVANNDRIMIQNTCKQLSNAIITEQIAR